MQNDYIIKGIEKDIFKLTNEVGQVYIISVHPISCTCAAHRYRNFRSGEYCKHITAVFEELKTK